MTPVDPSCAASPSLVAFLVSLGATREQITEAEARSGLVGLGADLVFTAGEGFTAEDLAARTGADTDQVLAIWRALGVEVPGPDTAMFSSADVSLVQSLISVDMYTDDQGDELLHVIGSALSRIADAAISFYVQTVEYDLAEGGAGTLELARKSSAAALKALELGAGLGAVFVHLMRDGVDRQRRAQAHVSDRAL